jgi:hypothetical protein
MLDPLDPDSIPMYDASALLDAIMMVGREMTLAPSAVRLDLLARHVVLFERMRALNRAHFGQSELIAKAIDEYEAGIRRVAALGDGKIMQDRRDGEGDCPYCGTKITKFNPMPGILGFEDHFIAYCEPCSNLYMQAKKKLSSCKGFATDLI